jgi:arabinofuranan 3-O-arabinosyltransferase
MTAVAAPAARGVRSRGRIVDTVIVTGLAILAYVPFLASSPHLLSADTKEYLYLDPGRLLSRAPYLWDPHVGMGTVPHQQIGYLFPMGPYFWFMDRVGVPDWIAQRLWLGTISLAAVLGARWLFTMLGTGRAGALAGALVYMLTPYQLAFTARISVILLAWAALPWLVGLTIRAVRNGGWFDPALFALVFLAVGSVNASSLVFVAIAPALWLLIEALGGRAAIRRALEATARIAVLSVGVSLWWIVGLRMQGAYGLPVLQLTETLRTVATKSDPVDLLRGLGNWYFYGFDRFGFSIEQAASYVDKTAVIAASFAVPVLALCAAGFVRWRHRGFFAALVVVGTVVGVGAWPYDDPSAYGTVFKWFANDTAAGLALRNTPRVVPVLVLGLAGLLAAGVGALAPRRRDWIAAAVVVVLVAIAFAPVWRYGYLSDGVARANDIPDYWKQAAAAMQADGNKTRVLEIPGSDFSAYRWGDTIEPVTPGLIDRPYVAREVLPSGTPPSVNLLVALDHRIQEGTLDPAALAAYARLINAGTISVRSDLAYERFNTPNPRVLWQQLTQPLPPGLRAPRVFGAPVPNPPPPATPELDEPELRTPATVPNPPPVALFEIAGAVPIVHAAPSAQPVVLAGDGEGIVDAIGAGLLDGNQLVFELASLANPQLQRELRAGADLVLTDSNRRRSERWFTGVRDNTGATEAVGDPVGGAGSADYRLDIFPGSGDASRTVVEQHGGHASANSALGPADRAALAFDGDVRTAWRVAGEVGGQRLVLRTPKGGALADHVTLVQPQTLFRDRVITKARITIDDQAPITVDLGAESLQPPGQIVPFPARTVHKLVIEPLATNLPFGDLDPSTDAPLPTNAVGFAEVKLGDVRVRETVRLPVDFAGRIDGNATGHRIDVVLARLRYDPGRRDRNDEELALDRRFVLPDTRRYQLSGTARINPNAPDALLDTVLGTTAPGTEYTSSGHLKGDLDARASRAFDGDPTTAWTAQLGRQEGQFIDVNVPGPLTVNTLNLTVVADGRHPVPTELTLMGDGGEARKLTVPPVTDAAGEGSTQTVSIPFDPLTSAHLRLVVDAVRDGTTNGVVSAPADVPVSIAEVGLAGVPAPAAPSTVNIACRSDLVRVDGRAVAVQITGPASDARSGLPIEPCDGALTLDRGSNTVRTVAGLDTGIDLDRMVLSSDASGQGTAVSTLGKPLDESGAKVSIAGSSPDSYDLKVRTDGKPFWLVLGESHNDGWEAKAAGQSLGTPQLVNGFANGWLVRPKGPGTMAISLRWTPQRFVWIAFVLSIIAVLACLALIVITRRRRTTASVSVADAPRLSSPFVYLGVSPSTRALAALAIGTAVGAALVSRWWIGLIVGAATLVASRVAGGRIVLTAGAPLALALGKLVDTPELGWLAIGLLGADVVAEWLRARRASHPVVAGELLDDRVGEGNDLPEQ